MTGIEGLGEAIYYTGLEGRLRSKVIKNLLI